MGVLDGEEIPPTYYELPHELTLAAKVEDECYFKARLFGEWEEGSPGFVISFPPTHTHHHSISILVVFQPLFAGPQPLLPFPPRYSILLLRFRGGHGITRPTRKWLISARGPFLVEP
ncbi:hypothetical protein QR685DRAFT_574662 [Neurospora intermedia]|uniref:Uncharacterized protein n=1 Tax=Neurospora intermedia TaxID=5142 RepID=A0ABR3D5W1_NEUIN